MNVYISIHSPPDGRDSETAEEYFKRIQDETGTLILWPSRLKIGAKSKKGSHMYSHVINVYG